MTTSQTIASSFPKTSFRCVQPTRQKFGSKVTPADAGPNSISACSSPCRFDFRTTSCPILPFRTPRESGACQMKCSVQTKQKQTANMIEAVNSFACNQSKQPHRSVVNNPAKMKKTICYLKSTVTQHYNIGNRKPPRSVSTQRKLNRFRKRTRQHYKSEENKSRDLNGFKKKKELIKKKKELREEKNGSK